MSDKQIQQLNNWIIKEKSLDQVPSWIEYNRRYSVWSPDKKCMEDNLTIEEAREFCIENLDYLRK